MFAELLLFMSFRSYQYLSTGLEHTVPSRGRFLSAFHSVPQSFSINIYHKKSHGERTGTRPHLLGIYLWTGECLSVGDLSERSMGRWGREEKAVGALPMYPMASCMVSWGNGDLGKRFPLPPLSKQSRPEVDSSLHSTAFPNHFLSIFIIRKVMGNALERARVF